MHVFTCWLRCDNGYIKRGRGSTEAARFLCYKLSTHTMSLLFFLSPLDSLFPSAGAEADEAESVPGRLAASLESPLLFLCCLAHPLPLYLHFCPLSNRMCLLFSPFLSVSALPGHFHELIRVLALVLTDMFSEYCIVVVAWSIIINTS